MDYAEAYAGYAVQGIRQIDAEIVKKSHFWMETNYTRRIVFRSELHAALLSQYRPIHER